jgi:hypothetical protein
MVRYLKQGQRIQVKFINFFSAKFVSLIFIPSSWLLRLQGKPSAVSRERPAFKTINYLSFVSHSVPDPYVLGLPDPLFRDTDPDPSIIN